MLTSAAFKFIANSLSVETKVYVWVESSQEMTQGQDKSDGLEHGIQMSKSQKIQTMPW
jgi:hypothetical protein